MGSVARRSRAGVGVGVGVGVHQVFDVFTPFFNRWRWCILSTGGQNLTHCSHGHKTRLQPGRSKHCRNLQMRSIIRAISS